MAIHTDVGPTRARLRALVRGPKILLLDEATSALDSESERLVQVAMTHLMSGRTTIVVAHRLATIKHADTIFFLRGGTLAGSGTFQELVEQFPDFAEQAQLAEELAAAVRSAPKIEPPAAVWADGPSAAFGGEDETSFATDAEGDDRAPLATLSLDVAAAPGDIVVLVARAGENGRFDVLGAVTDDPALIDRAAARIG